MVTLSASWLKANPVQGKATEQTTELQNTHCAGLFPYLIANFQSGRGELCGVDTPLVIMA